MSADGTLLRVEGLTVVSSAGATVVDDLDLALARRETLGLLGGSGSGKSTTMRAVMDLLPRGLRRQCGCIVFDGEELTASTERAWGRVRGRGIAFIPQDPKASLVPVLKIGPQMVAVDRRHHGSDKATARAAAADALARVRFPDPADVMRAYPHELSGGMAQRVTIAMALLADPVLLVADEPTTGLDVVIQFSVLELLEELIADRGMSMILISHDLGVIANYTDRLCVMHRGRIVERGVTAEVFERPAHEYTRELIAATTIDGIDGTVSPAVQEMRT